MSKKHLSHRFTRQDVRQSGAPAVISRCHVRLRAVQSVLPLTLLGSLLLLSGCGSVGPSKADENFQRSAYVSGGVLLSQLEPDTSEVSAGSVDESSSGGASFSLGYDLNSHFSIEAHVAALGEASFYPRGSVVYTGGGLSAIVYGLGEPGNRALREGFSLYGRLGVGTLKNEVGGIDFQRADDVHLLAGAGMEYGLPSGLGLRVEVVAQGNDAKYAQLALIYRFKRFQGEPLPGLEDAGVSAGIDADADGVSDSVDQCLGTKVGAPVKNDGCAIFDGVVEGVNFQPGSDRLTDETIVALIEVAETLQDYPDIRVIIGAHTDNSEGSTEANLVLSKRRAIAVTRYLVELGIPGSRLKPQAFGESRPVTSNMTAQGRATNRRVEFKILQ